MNVSVNKLFDLIYFLLNPTLCNFALRKFAPTPPYRPPPYPPPHSSLPPAPVHTIKFYLPLIFMTSNLVFNVREAPLPYTLFHYLICASLFLMLFWCKILPCFSYHYQFCFNETQNNSHCDH